MTEEEIAKMKEDLKKEQDNFGRWMWFAVLEKLAHGDVTKFDEIARQNFILCLNLLSYWMEKDRKLAELQEQSYKQKTTIYN